MKLATISCRAMANPDVESTSPSYGSIQNSWPRVGLMETAAVGGNTLGRLVADGENWRTDGQIHQLFPAGNGDALEALNTILTGLRIEFPDAGAMGYVGFEAGLRGLGLAPTSTALDLWQLPEIQFLIYDRLTHPVNLNANPLSVSGRSYRRAELDELINIAGIRQSVSKTRYLEVVARIKDLIAEGQIYQANYTQAFELETALEAKANYRCLQGRLNAPYAAFLSFDACDVPQAGGALRRYPPVAIMCASPERFWRKRGNIVDSRPIKGTIERGRNSQDDRRNRRELLTSAKDRAELLMITDLVRNDLGRVADIGSVKTESLVRIRPTPSVWHLESTVTAMLPPDRTWVDVMRALHPAGSITGAPKQRATEIICRLEHGSRGPYCGAVGWVDAKGNADFAVGIRTCIQIGGMIRVHGGGGIVADSDPESEYYESIVKIAPLIDAFIHPSNPTMATPRSQEKLHA